MKMSEVVERYIALRDEKAAKKQEMNEIQAKMDTIEAKLLEAFHKVGVDSVKTSAGTAYTTTRTASSVADKETFMQFVKDNEEWSLLEVRAAKLSVEQYKEVHGGVLPPGLNWSETVVVNVRK